jgi:hypothetical protein
VVAKLARSPPVRFRPWSLPHRQSARIGDVLVAQGNLPEALKSYRDGLAAPTHSNTCWRIVSTSQPTTFSLPGQVRHSSKVA